MKRFILFFCLLSAHLSLAQNLVQGEYYWDSDPGQGNGTALLATDGSFDEVVEELLASGITPPATTGPHLLGIRVKDVNGGWSPAMRVIINVDQALVTMRDVDVSQAEYFWDTDPGQGSGVGVLALDGAFDEAIEGLLASGIPAPSIGIHTLNMRVKDIEGTWGPVFSSVVVVDSAITTARDVQVMQAEYFWDADPGQGSGTTVLATDGAFDQVIERLFDAAVPSTTIGTHTFNVRVKDVAGSWGPVFSTVIVVDSVITTARDIKLTQAEYYWDADPGQGNGTAMVATDGSLDEALEELLGAGIPSPAVGLHTLSIRSKDVTGTWSAPFTVVVVVDESITTTRNVKVVAGEYFFDADPGQGNGTPMVSLDGTFDSAIEGLKGGAIPSPVNTGMHVLYLRAKDVEGTWGPTFGIVVDMDTTINGFNVSITGTDEFCENDPLTGHVYTGTFVSGHTYDWTVTGGSVTSGAGTSSVTVDWSLTGPQSIKLVECDGGVCDSLTMDITINLVDTTVFTQSICQGDSYFAAGSNQTTSGTYYDYFTNVNGCDSIVQTDLTVIATQVVNVNASICQGDSLFLAGAWQTSSGNYNDTLSAASGCDSVIITALTVSTGIVTNLAMDLCEGDSAYLEGNWQSTAGAYTDVFTASGGCDSTVVTTVTLRDTSLVLADVAIAPGDSVFVGGAWQLGPGTFDDVYSGQYGCDSTVRTTVTVDPSLGIAQPELNAITVYPNPNAGEFRVDGLKLGDVLEVHTIQGAVVIRSEVNMTSMPLHILVPGTYTIQVIRDGIIHRDRVVVN